MAKIRTFIAVEFSEELKKEIIQIQQRLKRDLRNLKWVPYSNFHLTLKFLGDVESKRIPEMAEGLALAIEGIKTFSVGFAGLGGFPEILKPRVIWLGVDRGKKELIQLQEAVEKELTFQGFAPEKKPYSPHLTLARSRRDTNLRVVGELLSQIKVQPTRTDLIQSIRIMKSDLRPQGPIYTCLKEIPLLG
ncbi:2'-5' RNA ligase [Anoxybacter fermentans]|uniref:RNA 2',3'-cyclic phosphodiesterase n=1 Tax=Anoxybacter fermentans TaxID=1323375 RepID=A0A3S9SWC2_9FIRM|nr:RNA 2',3'-cyclic phosphodiesterase [Anoxybacter fermentans]AZR72575.1 2'-5' RNA ligase [Anoxybacter fermentans]